MSSEPSSAAVLRVGTWNVLSYDDEYNVDYGCPLSISYCQNKNDTISTTSMNSTNCTKQRYQRIWNILEDQSEKHDIICLQEVSDEFLALQQQGPAHSVVASNWTVVHRNEECAILRSNLSQFHIVTTYHLSTIPNLSGCNALPMVVLQEQQQQQQQEEEVQESSQNRISYLVGSVHVQASVSNMTLWYQSTVDAILNTTYDAVMDGNTTNTSFTNATNSTTLDWMQHPVMIILGGDFNHNLTALTNITNIPEIEQPPQNWTLIAPSPTETLVLGTTQKEYNYMGTYDGFLVSTTSMMLQHDPSTLPNTTTLNNITTIWNLNITNTFVNMKGFMPKVVYGFPQGQNRTIQTTAQFALVTTVNSSNMMSWNNTTFWNDTMAQDFLSNKKNDTVVPLQLLFSPSSDFTSVHEIITIVPYSHPIREALSDHLFVSTTFMATTASLSSDKNNSSGNDSIPPTNTNNTNTNNNTTNGNDAINTSKSNTFLSQLTPFGRTCVYIGMILMTIFVVRFIWKWCCCRRNSSSSSSSTLLHQQEFDRVSMTDIPPPIQ